MSCSVCNTTLSDTSHDMCMSCEDVFEKSLAVIPSVKTETVDTESEEKVDHERQCVICLETLEHKYELIQLGCCTAKYCSDCISVLLSRHEHLCSMCKKPSILLGAPLTQRQSPAKIIQGIPAQLAPSPIAPSSSRSPPARGSISHQCKGHTSSGSRCRNNTLNITEFCHVHWTQASST